LLVDTWFGKNTVRRTECAETSTGLCLSVSEQPTRRLLLLLLWLLLLLILRPKRPSTPKCTTPTTYVISMSN
jgi:hypothetical protein